MRALIVVVVGLTASGLALSACGNDSEGSSGSGGSVSGGGSGGSTSGGSGGSATGGSSGSATGGSAGSATGGSGGATGGSGGATGGSGGATGGSGGSGGSGALGACGNAQGQLFPPSSIWNTPVDTAALDAESSAIVSYLQQNHTASARFQIDFSFQVLIADNTTPHQSFTPTSQFYNPDCDPAAPPVPPGGKLEGMADYACSGGEDCHLIVVDKDECRLFEMWRANISSTTFTGGCQAVWDLKTVYPPSERGEYCTSADAAGLPIAAHLFSADDIQAGSIEHAIRFILPNSMIRADKYVHPATHSTSSTSGPSNAPPYGARLRLKASKDISGLNSAAQVVAKAMKKYGMILSDGGNITFTATADDFTAAKWASVGLGPHDLKPLQWSDFEVVDGGTRYDRNGGSCNHTPITK